MRPLASRGVRVGVRPEDLIAALGRGIAEAALAHTAPSQKLPKPKRLGKAKPTPKPEPRQLQGQMEMPFEPEIPVAPTITQEQLAEMEAVLQGKRGPLPGTYDPDGEYRPESIPWMS